MAELFNTTKQNISLYIQNIFHEGELQENTVVKQSLITAKEGKKYLIKEYLIKGYNLNVKRFKNNGGGVCFGEVLEKIRDIRSSEKVFWRKILDIMQQV